MDDPMGWPIPIRPKTGPGFHARVARSTNGMARCEQDQAQSGSGVPIRISCVPIPCHSTRVKFQYYSIIPTQIPHEPILATVTTISGREKRMPSDRWMKMGMRQLVAEIFGLGSEPG